MARLACILVIAFAAIGTYADEPEKLVNGIDTTVEEYPHVASLRINGKHFCGGSIIDKRYIVTAAHCVEPFRKDPDAKKKIVVVTGTTTLDKGGQVHEVEEMYYHDKYKAIPNVRSSGFDVGLYKLKQDIVFSDVQKPIELSDCTTSKQQGDTVTVAAWGTIRFKGPVSNVLQKIDAKYVTQNACQKYHLQRITKEEFCTFVGVGTGMCQGDSGSGVIHNGKIVGVVSGGRPCAKGIPDIHSNLCSHREWIEKTMKN